MGLRKRSVKSLVKKGDVAGLIERLDAEDFGEAWMGLAVLGQRAVPGLIDAMLHGKSDTASAILADIGAPAIPALAEVIRSGDGDCILSAGVAIQQAREKGATLPGDVAGMLTAVKTSSTADKTRRLAAGYALGSVIGA